MRPPLRTGVEMAEELGISKYQWAIFMRHDKNAPRPKLDNRKIAVHQTCWYDRREVLAWWKAKNDTLG
jgi:hypothetical protein